MVRRLPRGHTDEIDPGVGDDVLDSGHRRDSSVQREQVGREGRAGPLRRSVEAPDVVERLVPELEQPEPVRVGDLLAEVHRGPAVVGLVEPVERARVVLQQLVGEVPRRARRGHLAGHVPGQDEERSAHQEGAHGRTQHPRRQEHRDRRDQHAEQDDPRAVRREAEVPVRRLEDREPRRVVVEVDVHLVVGADEDVAGESRRRQHRPEP